MNDMQQKVRWRDRGGRGGCGGGGIYFLGTIGALVYFMQTADGFWSVVFGILKALVWPAFLVYYLLKLAV
jgi:hypothetical protein